MSQESHEMMTCISVGKKIMSFEETNKDVIDSINADFWDCYLCDMDGKCVEVLYNMRKHYRDGSWSDNKTAVEMNKKREELKINTRTILEQCIENKLALHIILGCSDFLNYYYYPNTDGTFERVAVTFENM